MILSRRHLLGSMVALAASGRVVLAQSTDGNIQMLSARKAPLALMEGGTGSTEGWIFGEAPGPAVVRAKQGVELKLRLANELDHEIWLHFFGVRGPADVMTINVPPGATPVDIAFTPPDAGTFWIGPLQDVSRHRDMGLVAMLIVEEATPLAGIVDLPLIVDDWKLDDSGAVTADFGDVEAMVGEGRLGNWFTLNNRFRPRLQLAPGSHTRLRVLNAANIRTMGLLVKGQDPLLLALDGHSVAPRPLGQGALKLAPGQRADLLFSPADGDVTLALDLFEDVVEVGYLSGQPGEVPPLPDNLALPPNPVSPVGAEAEGQVFPIVLEGGIKGGLKQAQYNGKPLDLRGLLEVGKGWAINGVAGPAAAPAFTVEQGQTVILQVENRTAFGQPLHLHGHAWQLPAAEGEALRVSDCAVVAPGETLRLSFVADNPGPWALHSLVAERYDGGLLASFVVEAKEL